MASVLVLDDDVATAHLQQRCLAREGHHVRVAYSAEEAFRCLRASPADLIVVDYRLRGEVTGLGFVAHLRTAGFDVPVVMVSGDRDERPIIQALRMGVQDFISKDTNFFEELPRAVTRVLDRVKLKSQLTGRGHSDVQWNGILIVEDEKADAMLQAKELKRRGYVVEVASDLASARAILQTKSIALILLDQRLKQERTGLEVYQALRATGFEVPAILVTGYSDSATAAKALRAGIREYVDKKPGYEQEVPAVVERVLEHLRLEREITDSNSRLISIISSASDAIFTVDERGAIELFNRAATGVFGIGTAAALGRPVTELLPGLFAFEPDGRVAVPRVPRRELEGYRGDGTRLPLEVTIAQGLAAGRPFYTVIARDMTVHKTAEANLRSVNQALLKANEALSRANDDMQQFAYISSHDLQEPLRVMTIFTQKLETNLRGHLNEESKQYMEYIVSSARRMSALVADALQYAQLSTSQIHPSEISMNDVFAAAVGDCDALIRDTGAQVTHDPLPVLQAQAPDLQAVLRNLITNAIKYRGGETPAIHASAERRNGFWEFWVKDNGIGFDPQYSEQIFRVFKRLHGQEIPGTGIGLALCKRIVENHGGRIWAISKPGHGSTFFFTIPAAED